MASSAHAAQCGACPGMQRGAACRARSPSRHFAQRRVVAAGPDRPAVAPACALRLRDRRFPASWARHTRRSAYFPPSARFPLAEMTAFASIHTVAPYRSRSAPTCLGARRAHAGPVAGRHGTVARPGAEAGPVVSSVRLTPALSSVWLLFSACCPGVMRERQWQ